MDSRGGAEARQRHGSFSVNLDAEMRQDGVFDPALDFEVLETSGRFQEAQLREGSNLGCDCDRCRCGIDGTAGQPDLRRKELSLLSLQPGEGYRRHELQRCPVETAVRHNKNRPAFAGLLSSYHLVEVGP